MQVDVDNFIKYYNSERLNMTLNDMLPIKFESVTKKCSA